MNKKILIINSLLIILFRVLDLISTKFAVYDFYLQERNLIVKIFKLNFMQFCIFDFFSTLIIIIIYIYAQIKSKYFYVKSHDFMSYLKTYFFKKKVLSFYDFLFNLSLKSMIILYGSIAPPFIIATSTIFIINNILVGFSIRDYYFATSLYKLLDRSYLLNFIIFILPTIILLNLCFKKMKKSYLHQLS